MHKGIINKYFSLFNKRQKVIFFLVIGSTIISSIIEVAGVASIMPFLDLISNKNAATSNLLINLLKRIFSVTGDKLIYLTGGFILLVVIFSMILKTLSTFLMINFTRSIEYYFSKRLIANYLNKDYEWFLDKNSSTLGKNLLQEIANSCNGVLESLMKLIAKLNLSLLIFLMLFLVNAKIAIQVFTLFSLTVLLLLFCFKKFIGNLSKGRLKSDLDRYKAASEVFGSVKEVKVGALENNYIQMFTKPALKYSSVRSRQRLFIELPRYIVEGLIISGLVLFMLYFYNVSGDLNKSIPLISLYLLSIYKLMPTILDIYSTLSNIKFYLPSFNTIYLDLKNKSNPNNIKQNSSLPIPTKYIQFKKVNYIYPNTNQYSLKNIDLKINIGSYIGLAGFTGSGKTTMIDILLGLLAPSSGKLIVDGIEINKNNLRIWQSNIGYVSQNVYLNDDTIAANIAFGESFSDINWENLYRAAKIACLDEFVLTLEDRYLTNVGERGLRISGGQKQRIVLARALYKNPSILVLDEATSSLDNITEKKVMENIFAISNNITVIIIAHKLSTIKKCDHIFVLNNGNIIGKGNYQYLIENNNVFKKLTLK